MQKQLLRALFFACITALVSFPIAAQNSSESSGVKGQANAQDTHIRKGNSTNSPDQKVVPPASKGGPAAKGPWGTCNVHIDNRTPLIVEVYVSGEYAGAVGPWGDLYPNVTPGVVELYARALFTDGSVLTFGPQDYRCSGNDFRWGLNP